MQRLRAALAMAASLLAAAIVLPGSAIAASGAGETATTPASSEAKAVTTGSNAEQTTLGEIPAGMSPLSMSQCAEGYFCMWENGAYEGVIWSTNKYTAAFTYVGSSFNDKASSLWNRHGYAVFVANNYPSGSEYVCIGAGWSYKKLGERDLVGNYEGYYWPNGNKTEANDSISSYRYQNVNYENCSGQPQLTTSR